MAETKKQFLEQLAKGNRVNLEQINHLQEQLTKLETVGVVERTGYSLDRPLGRIAATKRQHTLANVLPLTSERE